MTYIILRDTFGDGLETIPNIGVDAIDEHQLNDYIWGAAQTILSEDGYSTVDEYEEENIRMFDTLVIFKIVDKFSGEFVGKYIQDVLNTQEEKQNKEDYETYLKLKEKFEK